MRCEKKIMLFLAYLMKYTVLCGCIINFITHIMSRRDYLDLPDDQLVLRVSIILSHSKTNADRWRIFIEEIESWEPDFLLFKHTVDMLAHPENRYPANTTRKNEAKRVLKAKLRPFVQGRIYHNTAVTPSDLLSMGLPVHKTKHTRIPKPSAMPRFYAHSTGEREITFMAVNPGSGKRDKPAHVHGVKYSWIIDDHAPVNHQQLNESCFNRRTKIKQTFSETERGKFLFAAAQYQNEKGETGPWSDIKKAIIP